MKKSSVTQRRQFTSTFESDKSVESKEEKFSIKKELYRGIRDNDVDKIVGKPDNKDTETNFIYNEYDEIHNLLTETRRKHDQKKTVTNNLRKQIQTRKKELDELKAEETLLNNEINGAKQELQNAEDKLRRQTDSCQTAVYTHDVYYNMQQNLKQDNIVIKKRIFDTELELTKTKTRFRSTLNDATNKRKIDVQCQKMLDSIEKVVQLERQKRVDKISAIEEVIQKKQQSFIKRANRQKEIQQVVTNALNEKSPQQKEWRKLLLAHKLLSAILRSKIERQLAKHHEVQKAFHNIKLNTGVSQSDAFVEKYLTRQQTYGQLLNSISEKQPKLQKQQSLNEQLVQKQRELMDEKESQQHIQKPSNPEVNKYNKQLDNLNSKIISFEKQREAFYQWGVKFLKRYDSLTGVTKKKENMNYYEFYPRTDLVTIFKKVAVLITKNLDELNPKEQMVETILMKNSMREPILSDKYLERNTRIKTLVNDVAIDRDEEIDHSEDTAESDYLHDYRRNIKKDNRNNRRFRIKTKPY